MNQAEGVPNETLDQLAADYESALRAMCGKQGLPDEWEEKLAGIPRTTPKGRLKRVIWLAIYSELHARERAQARAPKPESTQVARQLLRREPVRVTMENGRVVDLTSRSYAAAAEIQAHAYAIRDLDRALRETEPLTAAFVRRVHFEASEHRRAIWAHTFTADGAPAKAIDECPSWWVEITPQDDQRFLVALLEAGPLRYAKLGEAPPPKDDGKAKRKPEEDFGWASLFAAIEREMRLPPAALYDHDLYQLLAQRRAGAPPPLELEHEPFPRD